MTGSSGSRRAVLCDLYGTLVDLVSDEERVTAYDDLARWLAERGLGTEGSALRGLYRDTVEQHLRARGVVRADIDIRRTFAEILQMLGARPPDVTPPMIDELCRKFRELTTVSLALVPGARAALDGLAAAGLRIALVSNAQRAFTMAELRELDLVGYFDAIVFSSDTGLLKPSAEMFEQALQDLGVDRTCAVHVGDNLFDDVWGAQRLDVKAIWLDRGRHATVPEGVSRPIPEAEISVADLPQLATIAASLLA